MIMNVLIAFQPPDSETVS